MTPMGIADNGPFIEGAWSIKVNVYFRFASVGYKIDDELINCTALIGFVVADVMKVPVWIVE